MRAAKKEREYQEAKWQGGVAASPAEMLLAIEDYVAEARKFWTRNPRPACDDFVQHTV